MRREVETIYHVLILTTFTVMLVLLVLVNLTFGWERWGIWAAGAICVTCWIIHFTKIWTGKQRLCVYIVMILCTLLFYGYHKDTLTDIPQLLCLLIIVLSPQKALRMIYLVAGFYGVLILENIFINHYLIENANELVLSRVALGVVCQACAVFMSRFFIRRDTKDDSEMEVLREDLAIAKGENEQFLSNVSHELRTPINAVNGISEILLHKDLPGDIVGEIETIQDAGKRLYRQVSDMLDFSELQTGHFYIQNENYEILSAINDAVTTVFGRDMKKQLEFAIDIDASFPKVLCGDVTKIKKILVCILDNAVKFTSEGGGYLYVSKRDEEYGINLNIDLWDTGIGMSGSEIRHLYEKAAYQKDTGMERRIGGMGLGMSIVQGIVAAMDGFCTIESKEGKGTHIHISIPQQVRNVEPAIHLSRYSDYRILCYFNKEKYTNPEIGAYYRTVIEHVRRMLKLEIHEMDSLDELKEAVGKGIYTHIFVAQWEYDMDPEFFWSMESRMNVAVFVDDLFELPEGSRITLLKKPIYVLAVVNYLKGSGSEGVVHAVLTPERVRHEKSLALVVDDDEMNLIVARGILKNLGLEVETADSGEHAIRICQENDYDIVFMDFMMPGLNGTDAMHRIREIREGYYKEVPIVALTANAVSSARSQFLRDGFDEFIPKPIEIGEMKKVLGRMLKEAQR